MARSCLTLISDWNRPASTRRAAGLATEHGCGVHVISKGDSGCKQYAELNCTALPNAGRDAGSVLEFVHRSYDALPDVLVFTGSVLAKHERERRLTSLLRTAHDTPGFDCASVAPTFQLQFRGKGSTLGELRTFRARRWQRRNLTAASPTPFGAWFEAHVGPWAAHAADVACFNVIFRTTRALLRRHPPACYANLARQVNVGDQVEAVHFVERAAGAIFGDGYDGVDRGGAGPVAGHAGRTRSVSAPRSGGRLPRPRRAAPQSGAAGCTWANGCCRRHRKACAV